MTTCKHCQCGVSGKKQCETCGRLLVNQCATCHNEIAHDQIVNQNIHIVGNSVGGDGVDRDPDAYGRADQSA